MQLNLLDGEAFDFVSNSMILFMLNVYNILQGDTLVMKNHAIPIKSHEGHSLKLHASFPELQLEMELGVNPKNLPHFSKRTRKPQIHLPYLIPKAPLIQFGY